MNQFGRVAVLEIGDRRIDGLNIRLRVRRSGKGFDGASIDVWNLDDDTYGSVGRPDTVTRVIAGYDQTSGSLVEGVTVKGSLRREFGGGKTIASWQIQERATSLQRPVSAYFDGPIAASTVLAYVAGHLGLTVSPGLVLPRDPTYAGGYVLYGSPRVALDTVAADCGARWRIASGRLDLIPISGVARTRRLLLEPGTGLIGYPTAQDRGRVQATLLMTPSLMPGDSYVLGGRLLAGDYVAEQVEHVGELFGADWFTNVIGRPRQS